MSVAELIKALKKMPKDARVMHLWDGALRTEINHVWLARSGEVATADNDSVCYGTEDRPAYAPTEEQNEHWQTPHSANAKDGEG